MQTVIREAIGAVDRLVDLGLSVELLRDAILDGERARAAFSSRLYPRPTGGTISHSQVVYRLRASLPPQHWEPYDESGLSLVRNKARSIAIAVTSGDGGTGTSDPLETKYTKGDATAEMLRRNAEQLELFPIGPVIRREIATVAATEDNDCVMWYLMRRRVGNTVSMELALPIAIGSNGRVTHWAERILLPPLDVTGIEYELESDVDDSSEVLDVPVERL